MKKFCRALAFTLALTFMLAALTARAADRPAWAEMAKCEDALKAVSKKNALPAVLPLSAVTAALHPEAFVKSDKEYEGTCGAVARELSYKKGTWAVVLLTEMNQPSGQGGSQSKGLTARAALVTLNGGKVQVQSRLETPLLLQDAVEIFALDTAAYKVTDSLTAWGFRWRQNFMYAGGGGADDYLQLFLPDGTKLQPILKTLLNSSSITAGDWHDDGTRDHESNGDTTPATIAVLKTKTKDHFDLQKKKGSGQCTLQWDGKAYATLGADPVNSVNLQ